MFDRLMGWVLNRPAIAKRLLKALSIYGAASRDRTVSDWTARRASADQAVIGDMATINARARQASRDDWLAASIRSTKRRHVVGTGITPLSQARDINGELIADYNRRRDLLWNRWANNQHLVDREHQKTLNQIMRLLVDERVTVGNGFVVLGYERRPNDVGLQLQVFEVEQLATDLDSRLSNGNEIRGGIEMDKRGRPLAYHVRLDDHAIQSDMSIAGTTPERIPADRVLHLHRQSRPRELISASEMAPVLRQMWQRQAYDSAEQTAKKLEAFLAFAITKNPEMGPGPIGYGRGQSPELGADGDGAATENGSTYREINFGPGTIPELAPGEDIKMLDPRRPGSNYDRYMNRQTGMIAAGVDLSYPLISRDFSGTTYSGQRQSMLEDNRGIDIEQQELIDAVLRPIYERFTTLAVIEGRLEAADFFDDAETTYRYLEGSWQPPPRPWIDPAKEAAAAVMQLEYQLDHRGDMLNRRGQDWRNLLDAIEEQRRYAESKGIIFPEYAQPPQPPEAPQPPADGEPQPDQTQPASQSTASAGDMARHVVMNALADND